METGSPEGWAAIPRWLLYSKSVKPDAKLVYIVIQSHANAQGTAWPKHATIAEESGLSISTVQRAISQLVSLDLERVERRYRKGGGLGANRYAPSWTKPGDDAVDESVEEV